MNKLQVVVNDIQPFANRCISKEYQLVSYSFSAKLEYLNKEQAKASVDSELLKTTDELMMLIRHSPILQSLADDIDNPNFLWESTFIETLLADEKKKYMNFNVSSLNLDSFTDNPAMYDSELPHFSSIIKYVVLIRYINYLKQFILIENKPLSMASEEPRIELLKAEQHIDFESKFENWQIDILTECTNKVKIFTKPITSKIMKDILSCKLTGPLQVAKYKNKMLAYLFSSLDNRGYITRDWQAVCAKNGLFLSSSKGIVLQQGHLSSAVNQNNEFPPKDCHIIDNYIKKLKRD